MLKNVLDSRKDLQHFLFIRGFLITNQEIEDLDSFPFYGNWKKERHGDFWYMAHNLTGMHVYEAGSNVFFIMGHAYNPFTMEHNESDILKRIAHYYGTDDYINCINELTGVYVLGVAHGETIEFHVDASGMQSACCGRINERFYISSHPQLIGDLNNLQKDAFVEELTSYKWYGRILGPYLPGDLTPFCEIKRIVPSIMYRYDGELAHHRFFFNRTFEEAVSSDEYEKAIRSAADILKKNMVLISRKWKKPWISLTGGIDSNTTFAAANGLYQNFDTFSYISAEKEVVDAQAAAQIADHFKCRHHIFQIPGDSCEISDYDIKVEIQAHNSGYVAKRKENESRKRFYLEHNCNCDVEVKSWVSETIRAYWYKYFGRKKMPLLSPKLYRNLYKIFITNRKLAYKIDRIFEEYILKYEYNQIPDCYSPADIHYNEVSWGSWGGMNISEMKFCLDITIPYNNRYFMDCLLKVPLEKRISDQHHLDMKKYLNEELYNMNIRVVNMKETKFRAFALNVIFTLNNILPF